MKNDFNYKWGKLFASKRYNTKDGVIKLTPIEQQELLDDSKKLVKSNSVLGDFVSFCKCEKGVCENLDCSVIKCRDKY